MLDLVRHGTMGRCRPTYDFRAACNVVEANDHEAA
jgi:hypothetical protein